MVSLRVVVGADPRGCSNSVQARFDRCESGMKCADRSLGGPPSGHRAVKFDASRADTSPMAAVRSGTNRRRASDDWVARWLNACSDLAELERSNPMSDAVIDEIDGRMIRVGDRWLADFASCNYLGFDLDREIIDSIPERSE